MATEARLIIDRSNPQEPERVGKLTQANADQKLIGDQIRERRKQIHQQAKVDAAGPAIANDEPLPPPPVREDIDTIEFTAPNGLLIEYGPRHDISLVDRIARLYNGRDPTVSEFRLTRILMGIRSIGGQPPLTVIDEITRTKLANQIGDELIDLLMYYDRLHWPPLQQSELPVIRKKLRT